MVGYRGIIVVYGNNSNCVDRVENAFEVNTNAIIVIFPLLGSLTVLLLKPLLGFFLISIPRISRIGQYLYTQYIANCTFNKLQYLIIAIHNIGTAKHCTDFTTEHHPNRTQFNATPRHTTPQITATRRRPTRMIHSAPK